MNTGVKRSSVYRTISLILIIVVAAVIFLFPLYWILTGAFKTPASVNSSTPEWWPSEWTIRNFNELFSKRSAPLWELHIPLSEWFTSDHSQVVFFSGPVMPAAFRWLINTVFMSVAAMALTCGTAALAGYALAKKCFIGRAVLFSLIVCAMALPKQVILIPLLREMDGLHLTNTLWSVIYPVVGWPFGVFLMKQFAEGIPGEILEAARIDGGGELKTFTTIVFPMIKPGVGALAIFTFINTWNDYFMQLLMLTGTSVLSMPLGISKMMGEFGQDYGLLMAGAALASVPIIIVFLVFQKYFTKGITMGAVKG